ncbi:hypothetical protein AY498_05775 [Corynebacterium ulcerans]|nr:hypothetical protein AY498_05775 [Corynebacterium ulcerans]
MLCHATHYPVLFTPAGSQFAQSTPKAPPVIEDELLEIRPWRMLAPLSPKDQTLLESYSAFHPATM